MKSKLNNITVIVKNDSEKKEFFLRGLIEKAKTKGFIHPVPKK